MILLPLLALLPLLLSSQADFCPAGEACLQFKFCFGAIDKVEFVDSKAPFVEHDSCFLDFHNVYRQTLKMEFRPNSASDISVRFAFDKTNISQPKEFDFAMPKEFKFAMNEVRFKIGNETVIEVQGAAISNLMTTETASHNSQRLFIFGNFTMKTSEPAHIAFANLTITSYYETWNIPKFSDRLTAISLCDTSDLVQACEKSDCQSVIDDAGRKVVCAGDAKKLWILSSAPNEWSKVDQITCKNANWTASDLALPAPIKTVCHETNPTELFCFDDLTKSCADEEKCDLVVTSTRVTCASTLRINTASNPFYRNWVAVEILCQNERWHWQPVNGTAKPTPIGDRKISCSENALAQGTALLSWTIGGSIGGFFIIFFAIAAFCYLRAKRKAKNDGRSRATGKETSLGVLTSSQRVAPPKSWHWPAEAESKRALVGAEAPSRDVTGPNEQAEFGTRSREDKSATVEATTFSGKSSKKK